MLACAVPAALTALLLLALVPISVQPVVKSNPAQDYNGAIERLNAFSTRDKDRINPVCQDRRWLSGTRTARAIVLVHGLTNCPKQYEALGAQLASAGVNVIAVRLPYHGYRDRDTGALAGLTADGLARATGEVIDAAHGLGDQVDVLGISGGGVAAAWAAQFRPDVTRAVIIAPVFGPLAVPAFLTAPAMRLMVRLPNIQTVIVNAYPYAYANNSLKAVGQTMLLGQAVRDASASTRPLAPQIGVLTNERDDAINNALVDTLVAHWREHGANVRTERVPPGTGLLHDVIDPSSGLHPEATVYPIILDMLGVSPSPSRTASP